MIRLTENELRKELRKAFIEGAIFSCTAPSDEDSKLLNTSKSYSDKVLNRVKQKQVEDNS